MRLRGAAILGVVAGLQLATPAVAQPAASVPSGCGLAPELEQRLAYVLDAGERIAYSGTMLIEYNNDREFVDVDSAKAPGMGSLLRLSREADAGAELVALRRPSERQPCELASYYAFSVESGQVVAGRDAYRLTIRPKDTLRLGYVMDVDSDNHIPLRVVTATPDGQVLERYEFARIETRAAPEGRAEASTGLEPSYAFAALPPGFALVSHGRNPVDYRVVSDGLSAVSVFVEPQPRALADGEGVVLRGATLAYTRGTADDLLITVLGEIPVSTARLLADAVRVERTQ